MSLEGIDVNLEISLKEYGIAWKRVNKETIFIFGVSFDNDKYEYDRFDNCALDNTMDIKEEYSCLDIGDVCRCSGMPYNEWNKQSFEMKIYDMLLYYGYIEIFGSPHGYSQDYGEIIKSYND